ncbi:ECs_2282 family putative zinc-binding protein [Xenorhabdus hominickii]|uniref:ECs_2282 family putative zinc-binding protein n=1 Tax=Xenorhabdus hominickii TaxID=351679 RepID=UPI003AB6DE0F
MSENIENIQIGFICPQCGSKQFEFQSEVKTLDELEGTICHGCKRAVTKDDVIAHSRQIAKQKAEEMIRAAFKGSKFKIR